MQNWAEERGQDVRFRPSVPPSAQHQTGGQTAPALRSSDDRPLFRDPPAPQPSSDPPAQSVSRRNRLWPRTVYNNERVSLRRRHNKHEHVEIWSKSSQTHEAKTEGIAGRNRQLNEGGWRLQRPTFYNRRLTGKQTWAAWKSNQTTQTATRCSTHQPNHATAESHNGRITHSSQVPGSMPQTRPCIRP